LKEQEPYFIASDAKIQGNSTFEISSLSLEYVVAIFTTRAAAWSNGAFVNPDQSIFSPRRCKGVLELYWKILSNFECPRGYELN